MSDMQSTDGEVLNMSMDKFLEFVNKAKPSNSQTGYDFDLKVTSYDGGLTKEISSEKKCNCCGNSLAKKILIVKFKKIMSLKIFQAEVLFLLFIEGKIPRDYCKYHDCVAGKEFIENIQSIEWRQI